MPDKILTDCVMELTAILIFGGDIEPADDPEYLGGLGWRSLKGCEPDNTGGMPSYERVQAGAILHRMNPNLLLVPSGGQTNIKGVGESPPIASVIAAELRQLGVPMSVIIEEPTAFTTREQVLNCSTVARARGWNASGVGLLATFWQFGRITAMMMWGAEQEDISPFAIGVTPFISMERTLASEDAEKWNAYFTKLYAHPAVIKTLVGEVMGTGQLWTGHSPQFPTPFRGFKDPRVP